MTGSATWARPRSTAALGEYVALLRRAHGFTQAELADAAGVPRRFVNDLEGGHDTLYVRRLLAVLATLDIDLTVSTADRESAGVGPENPPHLQSRPQVESQSASQLKDLGW